MYKYRLLFGSGFNTQNNETFQENNLKSNVLFKEDHKN